MRPVRHGTPLSSSAWERRHNALTLSLVASLPVVTALSVLSDGTGGRTFGDVLVLCMFASLAASPRVSRPLRSLLCVLGLLVAVVQTVAVTAGSVSAHLLFYVIVGLVGLYEDWFLNAVTAGYLAVFYGGIGTFAPGRVPGTIGQGPGGWLPHLAMLLATIVLSQIVLNIAGGERDRSSELASALAASASARQQATELHDGVLQHLAAASYALDLDERELAVRSIDVAVEQARAIVDRLNDNQWVDIHDRLRRLP